MISLIRIAKRGFMRHATEMYDVNLISHRKCMEANFSWVYFLLGDLKPWHALQIAPQSYLASHGGSRTTHGCSGAASKSRGSAEHCRELSQTLGEVPRTASFVFLHTSRGYWNVPRALDCLDSSFLWQSRLNLLHIQNKAYRLAFFPKPSTSI